MQLMFRPAAGGSLHGTRKPVEVIRAIHFEKYCVTNEGNEEQIDQAGQGKRYDD